MNSTRNFLLWNSFFLLDPHTDQIITHIITGVKKKGFVRSKNLTKLNRVLVLIESSIQVLRFVFFYMICFYLMFLALYNPVI